MPGPPRLDLVSLGRRHLAAWLAGQPLRELPFSDPAGFLHGAEDVVRLRIAQLDAAPAVAPWLLRAIVLRDERIAVGFIGFHAAPDERGCVELGYEIVPMFRRRGYATDAATMLIAWAVGNGVRTVRACVSPENAASLAMMSRLGFSHVGEQIDDEDGRELVFELAVGPRAP